MKIVVCIKQVPGTSQVEIDQETGVLKRDGAAAKINPYDLYSIETAMRLKELYGGSVTAVTMGPPQAEAMMKEAYMMGVDDAYIFSDRVFAGADVLATAYTLAPGISSVCGDFDILVCGKQTTDGDTAQVCNRRWRNIWGFPVPHGSVRLSAWKRTAYRWLRILWMSGR